MFECCKLVNVEGKLCSIDAGIDEMNRGGLIQLIVVCTDSILSIPDYNFSFDANQEAILAGQIQLKTDSEIYRFRFTPQTGGFSEPFQETPDGAYFDQLLVISIPKDRPEITWLKYKMRNKRYSFVYMDQNGIVKLLHNQRVKFDLDTKRKPGEYNGHILTARRAALTPSLHFSLTPGQTIEDVFNVAIMQFGSFRIVFNSGFAENQIIELPFTPVSDDATVIDWDQSVKLRLGTHYTINGNKIYLKFASGEVSDPTAIQIFYVYQDQGNEISGFQNHIETLNAPYSSGASFTVPGTPLSDASFYATYNDAVTLKPGIDYSISSNTITLLFGGSPSVGDEDVINLFYPTGGTAIPINGYKQHVYQTHLALSSGFRIPLPNTPISNSVMAWYDEGIRMRQGVHYNIIGDEVEILFNVSATTIDQPTIFDFWYAY